MVWIFRTIRWKESASSTVFSSMQLAYFKYVTNSTQADRLICESHVTLKLNHSFCVVTFNNPHVIVNLEGGR